MNEGLINAGHAHYMSNIHGACSRTLMKRECVISSLMNERDNAMLNANIHEYYMDVT